MTTLKEILLKDDMKFITDIVKEAPIDTFQTIGDFEKGASFRDKRDRQIITNPITLTKVKDFFKNTTVDFDFYFVNLQGRRQFAEKGVVTKDFIFKPYPDGLGIKSEQLKGGDINDNNITVFFVGNSAGEKVLMTAWTIAHRFGHSLRREYAFTEYSKWLESAFEDLLSTYYGKGKPGYSYNNYTDLSTYNRVKANLFNHIGTMRSARTGQIKRYFEFYYELFAQYLKDGKVTLNPLKTLVKTGTAAYGRPVHSYTRDVDGANEVLQSIERDFNYYAENVLSEASGKIFVM